MTKLTLELPASAAKKLATLTPAQLAELSATLGCEVKSVTVQPDEWQRRRRCNTELCNLPVYHDAVPFAELDAILSRHSFNPIPEDALPASLGAEGRVHVQVGATTWLLVSWYRMTPQSAFSMGRYEVVTYVS